MKKLAVLSTDTLHHRYFINTILKEGFEISLCIYETTHVEPPFQISPFYEGEEYEFEREKFFKENPFDLGVQVFEVDDINSDRSIKKIEEECPDLGIVFGTRRLSPKVISLFKEGLINVHRGMVLEYRGLDSALWAIYHGDYENIGVTIHKVDTELDTGEVISSQKVPLVKNMKIHELRYYSTLVSTELVTKALRAYSKGTLKSYSQNRKGRYYSYMPLELRKLVAKKFERYCQEINA